MIRITRQEEFSAAHRLYRAEWSEEENYSIYGNRIYCSKKLLIGMEKPCLRS